MRSVAHERMVTMSSGVRKRGKQSQFRVLNNAQIRRPGDPDTVPTKTYVRGASGVRQARGTDTYVIDGIIHTMDGKCHKGCENVV